MFIKKDLRKISEILSDTADTRTSLRLSKRKFEFQGSVKIICNAASVNRLKELKMLNVYDNEITNLNVRILRSFFKLN